MVGPTIVASLGGPANGWLLFAIVTGILSGAGVVAELLGRRAAGRRNAGSD